MNFIIVHGTYANPEAHWFPWLRAELEKLGHQVMAHHFPDGDAHNLSNWLRVLSETIIDEKTILVGHSIGVAFILRILEELDSPIRAAFLVAGFVGKLGNKYDEINKSFFEDDFNWSKIRDNAQRFYIYNSDDDPYVSLEKGEFLAKRLDTELNVVKGAGHFNDSAGYTEFPLLLENIKSEVER